jgi:hypothetical protein
LRKNDLEDLAIANRRFRLGNHGLKWNGRSAWMKFGACVPRGQRGNSRGRKRIRNCGDAVVSALARVPAERDHRNQVRVVIEDDDIFGNDQMELRPSLTPLLPLLEALEISGKLKRRDPVGT